MKAEQEHIMKEMFIQYENSCGRFSDEIRNAMMAAFYSGWNANQQFVKQYSNVANK